MKILIEAYLSKGIMKAFDEEIPISCLVRNEINRERKSNEVVYSMPDKHPIQPRPFPLGVWHVLEPRERTDPYLAPYFIPTDAYQMLPVWEIENGLYKKPTEKLIKDTAYGFHYSTSRTTQGCIKLLDKDKLLNLVKNIKDAIGEKIEIYAEIKT